MAGLGVHGLRAIERPILAALALRATLLCVRLARELGFELHAHDASKALFEDLLRLELVFAALNRAGPSYAGAHALDEALAGRFTVIARVPELRDLSDVRTGATSVSARSWRSGRAWSRSP